MIFRLFSVIFGTWLLFALAVCFLFTDNQVLMLTNNLSPQQAFKVECAVGDLLYSIRRYERGAFYFYLAMKEYPDAPDTETALFYWLQCQRFGILLNSREMVEACNDYLARFPEGERSDMVREIRKVYFARMEMGMDLQRISLEKGVRTNAQKF